MSEQKSVRTLDGPVSIISEGRGPERYSLRFAVDFTHDAKFSVDSESGYALLDFFGRQVQLQPAPFGVMAFVSDFLTESDAKNFGDRLRLACQLMSVKKAIPIFTDRDPSPIFRMHGFLESLAPGAREVDGQALQMSYTIIPEHKVILSYGELRGNLTRLVPPDYFLDAFREVELGRPKDQFFFDDAIDAACSFWSIACLRHGDIVRTVNIVAALEVLAAGAGVKGRREGAVREMLESRWPKLLHQVGTLPSGHSVSSFCKELFRRRNELVHTGHSNCTSSEISAAAVEICKALILEFSRDRYFTVQ